MEEQNRDAFLFEVEEPSAWPTVLLFAFALVILVIAFVWFVMLIDPLLSDFFPSTAPTPTSVETQSGP